MDKYISLVTAKVSTEKKNIQDELNPISWRKSNLWGFTILSKEMKIAAVSDYLSGMPTKPNLSKISY
ncbi:hypothetical protein Llac01_03390 [Leuconostoc lactis]|nr:hypothetical protein LLA04_13870 [Leuconostoc lactis]GLY44962.1 hypothetical protein Llac01_03390 [Leuconostoc lactis]